MDSSITYDLEEKAGQESKHSAVKSAMKKKGYSDRFWHEANGSRTTYYLPNTTLWKKNTTPAQAKADLLEVAKACNAVVERLFASEFTGNWAAIPGKEYA